MKIFRYVGDSNLDYRRMMREQVDLLIQDTNIPIDRLVICEQTHSNLVHVCTESDSGAGIGTHPQIPIADGFVTNIPELYLLIRTADCTPVILWDETLQVVAVVHSGREGTRKNIVGNAILLMIEHFGCTAANIKAIIGPGICQEHYEVSHHIYNEFIESIALQGITSSTSPNRQLDIQGTIFNQIRLLGVPVDNIEYQQKCTYESLDFFSFRRDGTKNRQINIIGIKHE